MKPRRHISQMVGVCALIAVTATLVACGSSGSGGSPSTSPAAPSSTPATSPTTSPGSGGNAAAAAAIKTNWEAFFNNKTPVNKRIALLQDGQQFATTIRSMAGSGLAALATAKVTDVTVNSPSQATVKYEILVGGSPQLKQTGVAVNQNGTWKVGVASFCGLLIIENAGKTSGLPAACKSA